MTTIEMPQSTYNDADLNPMIHIACAMCETNIAICGAKLLGFWAEDGSVDCVVCTAMDPSAPCSHCGA